MSEQSNGGSQYAELGVDSQKKDVHAAIADNDKGLYPTCFCQVQPDADLDYCVIPHSDGAGTKASLAYLYATISNDNSVFGDIAKSALVMNLDDVACAGGVMGSIYYSSMIDYNPSVIDGAMIAAVIRGNREYINKLRGLGINIYPASGETAQVGDTTRNINVNGSMFVRMKKSDVIVPAIKPGDIVISFASYGQAKYEDDYNSGMGDNGLTLARHGMLSSVYRTFTDTYNPHINRDRIYRGKHELLEQFVPNGNPAEKYTIGKMLLSPSRTYAPLIKMIMEQVSMEHIHAFIHNSGGGQTKVKRFLDNPQEKLLMVTKNALLPVPKIFRQIQEDNNVELREMFVTFNMGQRLEAYFPSDPEVIGKVLGAAEFFGIDAQVSGFVTERKNPHGPYLRIVHEGKDYDYFDNE